MNKSHSEGLHELHSLVGPLKELVAMKDDLRSLLQREALKKKIKIDRQAFEGKVTTTSFRVYDNVMSRFRLFANSIEGIKNQDLFSQALLDFMTRYEGSWDAPIVLELGANLVSSADERVGGKIPKMVRDTRKLLEAQRGLSVPPVRIRDDASLRPNAYRITVDGVVTRSGTSKGSAAPIIQELRGILRERARKPAESVKH